MDLVSPLPLAFMSSSTTNPCNTQESLTLSLFQPEAEGYCDMQPFPLDGYPAIEHERISIAVGSMKFVHSDVNRAYALTRVCM